MTKKTTVSIFGGGFVGGTTYKVLKQLEEKQWDSWQIHLYDVNPEIATVSKEQAITEADIAFVAVPTPTDFSRKTCDTSIVESVVREIRQRNKDCEIIIKSTVTPGTTEKLAKECSKVFFNPEFLLEKSAIQDFIDIEYQFLGIGKQEQSDENVFEKTQELFKALSTEKVWNTKTIILGDCTNIELVKYGRNSYLALRLSYFQELRAISEALGCDPEFVKGAVGLDPRIGNHYNTFNGKWGAKCLPKDINALMGIALEAGVEPVMLEATWERNMLTPGKEDWHEIPGAVVKKVE